MAATNHCQTWLDGGGGDGGGGGGGGGGGNKRRYLVVATGFNHFASGATRPFSLALFSSQPIVLQRVSVPIGGVRSLLKLFVSDPTVATVSQWNGASISRCYPVAFPLRFRCFSVAFPSLFSR